MINDRLRATSFVHQPNGSKFSTQAATTLVTTMVVRIDNIETSRLLFVVERMLACNRSVKVYGNRISKALKSSIVL